ncbi:MAG: FG-GAP repeat domain-containing protein [Planctomycetota bacterium]|jgi:hypothetical protein
MAKKIHLKHCVVVSFVILVFGLQQVKAKNIPFGDANTIDGHFNGAQSVYAADVDGDGDLDVLGAAYDADDISWWENTAGDGTSWTEHAVDSEFDGASCVYAADVDGDGDMDVLGAAFLGYEIAWWENTDPNGDGTSWTEHAVDARFDGASSVYAADVDGDGDMDVLGAGASVDAIMWWENTDPNGNGTSWTGHEVDSDFDGAQSVYAADVDGDGDLDVLGAAYEADDIAWWENTAGDGTSWTEHAVDSDFDGASCVYAADVDGDGDLDVLGAAYNADDMVWWDNTVGDGTNWAEYTVDFEFDGASCIYAADVDSDGDLDVLGAAGDSNEISWWENTVGVGTSWTEHTVDNDFDGASCVYAADVNDDGDPDILGAASLANDISWWENMSRPCERTFSDKLVLPSDSTFDGAYSVYAADVDGDGDMDILGAAYLDNDITWWENIVGSGVAWIEHTIEDSYSSARSVYAADVDGDGDTDVLGAASNIGKFTWWENTVGDGTSWTRQDMSGGFAGAGCVYAADVDGDGDIDILGAAWSADKIIWWENTAGDGTSWTEHNIDSNFVYAMSVSAADVDGDGDIDVLGAAYTDGDITWWENTVGDGTSWTEHTVDSDFDMANCVYAADVDDDGDIDVLGAAGGYITWWENMDRRRHKLDGAYSGYCMEWDFRICSGYRPRWGH